MLESTHDCTNIKSGMRIEIPNMLGVVLVKNIEHLGKYVKIDCIIDGAYKEITRLKSEMNKIKILPDAEYDMKGDAQKLFLGIEKKRFELASLYEPLISMQNIHPLPHQIEAVYNYLLTHRKIRHLLAHDAGAGKTIMTGSVIKELKIQQDSAHTLNMKEQIGHTTWFNKIGGTT